MSVKQRGTTELKKYLRSRMEEPATPGNQSVVKSTVGQSGVIGGGGEGISKHDVSSSKTLIYR